MKINVPVALNQMLLQMLDAGGVVTTVHAGPANEHMGDIALFAADKGLRLVVDERCGVAMVYMTGDNPW